MRSCLYLERARWVEGRAAVAAEEPLEIRVNGSPQAVLMRTPGHEVELAAGFCLTERVVDSFSEILSVGFYQDAGTEERNIVNVVRGAPAESKANARGGNSPSRPEASPSRASNGLCGIRILEHLEHRLEPLSFGCAFAPCDLAAPLDEMTRGQDLLHLTNGTHAVALSRRGGEVLAVREDIGLHNALDKAIGFAMLRHVDCAECAVLLSGRISFEMVQKAVRAGFGVVAATSAATDLAVELAARMSCTLVGRVSGDGMIVYTHPFRIEGASRPPHHG